MKRKLTITRVLGVVAVAFGILACGAEPLPARDPAAPGSAVLASFESDPGIMSEVNESGAAKRSAPQSSETGVIEGAPQSADLLNRKCVCCKLWGDRVICTYIPCDSDCTY